MTLIIESEDAPSGLATRYVLADGTIVHGSLAVSDVSDTFRFSASAGQRIAISLVGIDRNCVQDAAFDILDAQGNRLFTADNELPNLNANLCFTAATAGDYWIVVRSHDHPAAGVTEDYGLSLDFGPISHFDAAMAAGVIDTGYSWSSMRGTGASVTYAFRQTVNRTVAQDASGKAVSTGAVLTPGQEAAAKAALNLYSDVANLTFVQVAPGGHSDNATILFGSYLASDGAGAYAYYPGSTSAASQAGDVWLNRDSFTSTEVTPGGYEYFALIHELGHAMGLSHPGIYDASAGATITYANSAQFVQDSRQYTVMSYFDETNTIPGGTSYLPADASDSFHFGYPTTLLMFDILALQTIYGANYDTRSGDTTYGFNSNAGPAFTFQADTQVAFCIWDGGGTDTIDLSGYSGGQSLSLIDGSFSNVGGLSDNLSIAVGAIIENAVTGSGDDTIIGNAADNLILAGAGNDSVQGGDGNDSVTGGAGNDTLDGGMGLDTAYFLGNFADYSIVLDQSHHALTIADLFGADGSDTILDFEFVDFLDTVYVTAEILGLSMLYGGGTADLLIGTDASDTIYGFGGDDTLYGGLSDDELNGGAENDLLDGGAGNDTMAGGTGDDIYVVDSADDLVVEAPGEGADTVQSSVTFVLTPNVETLILTEHAATNGTGNALANLMIGNSAANLLQGGDGGDTLIGGGGDDTLNGGAGFDIASYDGAAAVTVSLSMTTVQATGGAGANTLIRIEGLIGSAFDDSLTGDSSANRIEGGSGNDTMTGGPGADSLYGGEGNDLFLLAAAADVVAGEVISGGNGLDELRFNGTIASTLVLTSGVAVEQVVLAPGTLALNLNASAAANGLTILGNSAANVLVGTTFADTIDGGAGNDVLTGGGGDDQFLIASGVDVINDLGGGDGLWVAAGATASATVKAPWTASAATLVNGIAALSSAGFSVDLSAVTTGASGFKVIDTGASVNFTGSSMADSLGGGFAADMLAGGAGNDTLNGGSGNDTLIGGSGIDTFVVTADTDVITDLGFGGTDVLVVSWPASVTAVLSNAWTASAATSNSGSATLITAGYGVNLSAITQGSAGFGIIDNGGATILTGSIFSDAFWGGAGNDALFGGNGNDTLNGGAGDDSLNGGSGLDLASYDGAAAGVTVSLAITAAQNTGGAGTDILSAMEGLIGSSFGDSLSGDGGTNWLQAGAGNDTLSGGAGNDSLFGGSGNDLLDGGTGNDSLTGGEGIDRFLVAGGTDKIADLGLGGADILIVVAGAVATVTLGAAWTATAESSNSGTETLTTPGFAVDLSAIMGGTKGFTLTNTGGAATLTGSGFADLLTGGSGDDTLMGSAGNDSLIGGAGNDWLVGGTGNDSLIGGAGNDRFVVDAGSDTIADLGGADVLVVSTAASVVARLGAAWTATAATTNAGSATLQTGGLAVNLSAVAGGTAGFSVTNSGSATTLTGSALGDTLTGSTGADTLNGAAGNDLLSGGGGKDVLSGGLGADTFVFSTLNGPPHVTDFASGIDHLALSRAAMGALGPAGALSAEAFWSADGAVAGHDPTDRVVYNSATGSLYYDPDGSGPAASVQIAVLDGAPVMALGDLLIF